MNGVSELRQEVASLREFVIKQNKELEKVKRFSNSQEDEWRTEEQAGRLKEIEGQLADQKQSTARITKLCLAAIKALEKLEERPGSLEIKGGIDSENGSINSEEASNVSQESLAGSVDGSIGKILCEEMSRLNKMLIKVDEDIDALDERTNENQSDCEHILSKMREMEESFEMVRSTSSDLAAAVERSSSAKQSPASIQKEVEAVLASRDLVTRADLNRGLKTIPVGPSKDDITNLIDKATSNFLRTLQAETKVCGEKVQDMEELVKSAVDHIKSEMEKMEENLKKDVWKVQDNGEKVQKDVNKLRHICNNIKTPDISSVEKRLDEEVKQLTEIINNVAKDESRTVDESKFNIRMERLGKEISIVKQKITDQTNTMDEFSAKQRNIEEKHGSLNKLIGSHQEEVKKVGRFQQSLDSLGQKIELNDKLCQDILNECHSKIDKTEVDDLKNGMEKERCKINYFQDKIMHIAKSVESVKIENNNMRDKFCSDIDLNTSRIHELEKKVDKQEKVISENSATLKDITKDSIQKIKEVANNSLQIEKNIRQIKDKSILYDNQLKEMKDQISENQYREEQDIHNLQMELSNIKTSSHNGIKDNDLDGINKKIKLMENDIKNFKQDRKTKENEDEERQLSLEGSLLDLRSYVETILTETNSQLSNIAIDVDAAQEKITKCGIEVESLVEKHDSQVDNSTYHREALQLKLSEIREFAENKHLDSVEKIMDLRKEFLDKQGDLLTEASNSRHEADNFKDLLNSLKEENSEKIGADLYQMRSQLDTKVDRVRSDLMLIINRNEHDIKQLTANQSDMKISCENGQSELRDTMDRIARIEHTNGLNTNKVTKLDQQLETLNTRGNKVDQQLETLSTKGHKFDLQLESMSTKLDGQATAIQVLENTEKSSNLKEISEKQAELKTGLDLVGKHSDSLRKEMDTRLENFRKNVVEMIGNSEIKVSDAEDRIKVASDAVANLKVVENNHNLNLENKIASLKSAMDSILADKSVEKNKISVEAAESFSAIKKDLDQIKVELSLYDMESFKNVVNSTNETQNKLISSIQKNLDNLLKEKQKSDTTFAAVNAKISDMFSRTDHVEKTLKDVVNRETEGDKNIEERIRNIQMNIREIHEKLNNSRRDVEGLAELKQSIDNIRTDVNQQNDAKEAKFSSVERKLDEEINKMRKSIDSCQKELKESLMSEVLEATKAAQEKSGVADTKFNQLMAKLDDQNKKITHNNKDITDFKDNLVQTLERVDNFDTKLKSISDVVNSVDLNSYASKSALKTTEDGLKKTLSDKSNIIKQIEDKTAKLATQSKCLEQDLDKLRGTVKTHHDTVVNNMEILMEKEKGKQQDDERPEEINKINEDLKSLSSKFNQQKAKLIDVEAMVTFQERSVNKIADDVKKMNGSVFGNIANLEDKMSKIDTTATDINIKYAALNKRNDAITKEFESFTSGRSRLESKIAQIDVKADSSAVEKVNYLVRDEVNRIQKEIKDILTNIDNIKSKNIHDLETKMEWMKGRDIVDIKQAVDNIKTKDLKEIRDSLDRLKSSSLSSRPEEKVASKDIERLDTDLRKLTSTMDSLKTGDIKALAADLERMKAGDLKDVKDKVARIQDKELKEMKDKVAKIQDKELKDVKDKVTRMEDKELKDVWNAVHNIENVANKASAKPEHQDYINKEQFSHVDISVKRLLKISEDLQSKLFSVQESTKGDLEKVNSSFKALESKMSQVKETPESTTVSSQQPPANNEKVEKAASQAAEAASTADQLSQKTIPAMETKIGGLERMMSRLEEELKKKDVNQRHQDNQLSHIEKRRRGWEGAMEKAEEMAQIFDSLIITNDRPYVSCGIDDRLTSPGAVSFTQFELINKIEWESEDCGFNLLEPGVYLLHIAGSLHNCTASVQLVSEQLEAELVSLRATSTGTFRSKMTIFTVEDDDRDAEKIIVDLNTILDGDMSAESDFSLLMYKISEVSTSDSGDAWKPVF